MAATKSYSLDPNAVDGLAFPYGATNKAGEVVQRPAATARQQTAAMNESKNGMFGGGRGAGWHADIERQTMDVIGAAVLEGVPQSLKGADLGSAVSHSLYRWRLEETRLLVCG